jgi:ribose/xylose/arabinose/galactoside ABC-type transport system permease subunit
MSGVRVALALARSPSERVLAFVRRPLVLIGLLLALLLIVGNALQPVFLTAPTLQTITENMLGPMLLGLGASLALYAGLPDLSIGSVLGLGAMVFAVTLEGGGSIGLAITASLAGGAVVGAVNAVGVVRFGADPVVVTLGTLAAAAGVTLLLSDSQSKVVLAPLLEDVAFATVGSLPTAFLVIVVLYGLAAGVMSFTRLGRHVQAVGGNELSARRAAIPAGRIKAGLLILSGVLSAAGGLIVVGQLAAAPATLGVGVEFQVFAAILISGFSFSTGGVGNPLATLLGLSLLAALLQLLRLENVPASWQQVVTGIVLLGAVYLDGLRGGESFR